MLTEFVRDHAFAVAWFGLMTMAWFGWGQEDPPASWRPWLGAGSIAGVALAGLFGYTVFGQWATDTALAGHYAWFGVVVGLEVIAAGAGCFVLWRQGRTRWMAWWVALVVAVHFAPLAFFLDDLSLLVLALVQVAGLVVLRSRLGADDRPSSRLVGPFMGASLLTFAVTSAIVFFIRVGTPW